MDTPPTHATLRRLLELVLITDSDFEAFCHDFFPEVSRRFASGNDRLQKATLLLRLVRPEEILARLREAHAVAVAKHEGVLAYSWPRVSTIAHRRFRVAMVGLVLVALGSSLTLSVLRRGHPSPMSAGQVQNDAGVAPSGGPPQPVLDAFVPDQAATAGPPWSGVPVLKIFNERQRKNAAKLSAPITSIEQFFQNAIDLGEHAELVTYKKIDPAQRQWLTQVVLVDGRNQRPVSMIIYSEAQYRGWVSDTSSMGAAVRATLVNIEKVLSEIAAYKVSAEEILKKKTAKTLEDAAYAFRFQDYAQAIRLARAVAQDSGETASNRATAWQLVAISACSSRQSTLATEAMSQLGRLSPGMQQNVSSVCRSRGMR